MMEENPPIDNDNQQSSSKVGRQARKVERSQESVCQAAHEPTVGPKVATITNLTGIPLCAKYSYRMLQEWLVW